MKRYRWRTWLRGNLPWWLADRGVAAKGRGDCGDHEWYVAYRNLIGQRVQRCYHCERGCRVHPEDRP